MLSLNLFCLAFGLALLPTILTAPTQAGTTHDRDTASVTKPVLDPPIPDLSQWLLRDLNSYQGVEEVWENVNGENGKTKTFEACKEWFGKVGFDVEGKVMFVISWSRDGCWCELVGFSKGICLLVAN
jgi:hypothetical protein